MNQTARSIVRTGGGADIAFAVVVLASYFAMFSGLKDASLPGIALMMVLGTAYIAIGIYGYGYCTRSNTPISRIAYFGMQIPLGGLIVYLGKGVGFNALLLLPLAGQAVVLLPRKWTYGVNTGIALTYAAAVALFSASWQAVWDGMLIFLAGLVFITVFTQMAVSEEKARKDVERLLDELAEANQRLRLYALQIEELATTKERNRLAREIHDGLGHFLTTIHIQIQAARAVMSTDLERALEALNTAQNMTQEALLDVRNSVSTLRMLPETSLPLPEGIEKLLDGCELIGIEAKFNLVGTPRALNPQTQLALYRAAQEGITNTRKHAQASEVIITLDFSDHCQVSLVVWDDGVGAQNLEGGFGLIGLEERLHLLNGSLTTHTTAGHGFKLEVVTPG